MSRLKKVPESGQRRFEKRKVVVSVVGKEPARCVSTRVDHHFWQNYGTESRGSSEFRCAR
jgi:hypothetical protein